MNFYFLLHPDLRLVTMYGGNAMIALIIKTVEPPNLAYLKKKATKKSFRRNEFCSIGSDSELHCLSVNFQKIATKKVRFFHRSVSYSPPGTIF